VKILVVDDSQVNARMLAGLAEQLGHSTTMVFGGAEALQKLESEEFAAILLDCQMPEIDGFAVAARWRELESRLNRTRLLIVAVTGEAGPDEVMRCLEAGMDTVLQKPLKKNELARALESTFPPTATSLNAGRRFPKSWEPESVREELLWDWDKLDEVSLGDPIRQRRLARIFLEETTSGWNQLQQLAAREDFEGISRLAHRLAGSSATCGAARFGAAVKKIELLPADRVGEVSKLMDTAATLLGETVAELKNRLKLS
jgi:two-component system sensor histidine kinase/response regulator